ncbi:hypothetical protein CLOM_g23502 [Closterium sp. NIES-68]|nr:hypothetical protein CLOM_g23502 [Closterium sp. NIES-68]
MTIWKPFSLSCSSTDLSPRALSASFLNSNWSFWATSFPSTALKSTPRKSRRYKTGSRQLSLRELQSFLGFVNYVRCFIPNMAGVASPLMDLLKRGKFYEWGGEQQAAFEQLKFFLTTHLVLRIADPHRPFELITDASDLAVGAVLLQDFGEGLQPITYESRKLNPAERNYRVHDKELLAIFTLSKSGTIT